MFFRGGGGRFAKSHHCLSLSPSLRLSSGHGPPFWPRPQRIWKEAVAKKWTVNRAVTGAKTATGTVTGNETVAESIW